MTSSPYWRDRASKMDGTTIRRWCPIFFFIKKEDKFLIKQKRIFIFDFFFVNLHIDFKAGVAKGHTTHHSMPPNL